jgi:hypothetical protein
MALRAIWQFMDRDVTLNILYGPYTILWVTDRSINCHLARSAMDYILHSIHLRRIGTASFNDGGKIRRKFASSRAKWDSWRELLLGENYSPTSICLLAHPVNILVYWPGPINMMFSSGFCPNSFFVLDIQLIKKRRLTDLHVLSVIYSPWHFGPNGSLWTGLSPTK